AVRAKAGWAPAGNTRPHEGSNGMMRNKSSRVLGYGSDRAFHAGLHSEAPGSPAEARGRSDRSAGRKRAAISCRSVATGHSPSALTDSLFSIFGCVSRATATELAWPATSERPSIDSGPLGSYGQ